MLKVESTTQLILYDGFCLYRGYGSLGQRDIPVAVGCGLWAHRGIPLSELVPLAKNPAMALGAVSHERLQHNPPHCVETV